MRAGAATLLYQRHDWDNERMGEWVELDCPPVVIVEGIFSLRPELADLVDLGVDVDASAELRLARQRARRARTVPG